METTVEKQFVKESMNSSRAEEKESE